MPDDTFDIGDRVELNSGGPVMTVVKTGRSSDGEPLIWCVWFGDTNQKPLTASFPPDALKAK